MRYECEISSDCNLCGDCVNVCTGDALSICEVLVFDADACQYCESCIDVCPEDAIKIMVVL